MSKKKHYKIIPIKVLLKNNRTAKAGEKVEGSAFINLQHSLDNGFCKLVKDKKDKNKNKNKNKNKDNNSGSKGVDVKKLADLTAKELEDFATEKGIELTSANKASKAKTIEAIEAGLAKTD